MLQAELSLILLVMRLEGDQMNAVLAIVPW